VAAEIENGYIKEEGDIVVHVASRFERNEVDIGADAKSD
jgi:hypothetical protein